MSDDDLLVGDAERERAVAVLQQATEEGRLTLGEYSSRLDSALAARTRGQLGGLVRDIPSSSIAVRSPSTGASRITAIFGSNNRTGRWRLAGETEAISIFGSCKLDLRDAEINGGEIVINVMSVLGSIDILVPPGVQVEMEQVSVLAGSSEKLSRHEPIPSAPIVRIRGSVILGHHGQGQPAGLARHNQPLGIGVIVGAECSSDGFITACTIANTSCPAPRGTSRSDALTHPFQLWTKTSRRLILAHLSLNCGATLIRCKSFEKRSRRCKT